MSQQTFPRRAGIGLPLFSLRGEFDAGSGTMLDLLPFLDWLRAGRQTVLQLLPLNESPPGEMSPYTTLSAFAFDPEYIAAHAVVDVQASHEAQDWLRGARVRGFLERMQRSRRRWRRAAQSFQKHLLEFGFAEFEHAATAERRAQFDAYRQDESSWLDAYAHFRALYEKHGERPWWEWPDEAEPDATRVRFAQYVQWIAAQQWSTVRRHAAACDVLLKGDLTFVCGRDSADVWSRQDEFDATSSAGAPPDAFSETGQKWDLPLYRWDQMRARNFDWWRARVRQAAALYDMVRIDHVVGLFRTYAIPIVPGGTEGFVPSQESEQYHHGTALMDAILEAAGSGCRVVAEDLGTVPDWVRHALHQRTIPGYKVFRWEMDGSDFAEPRHYPELSIATSGTHDTDTLAQWLGEIDASTRHALQRLVGATDLEAILRRLYDAGSALTILPLQDVFGWPDRINVPGTSNRQNWSYRLPTIEALRRTPAVMQRWEEAARLIEASGR